jgi:hypothetical protein
MIDVLLNSLSNSKIFIGCVILLSTLGGKYLSIDLPKNIEVLFLKYFILRGLVLFSIFFMATRDIKSSILLFLLFFIIMNFFINEKSSFCVIQNLNQQSVIQNPNQQSVIQNLNQQSVIQNQGNIITRKEYENALEIIKKYENIA